MSVAPIANVVAGARMKTMAAECPPWLSKFATAGLNRTRARPKTRPRAAPVNAMRHQLAGAGRRDEARRLFPAHGTASRCGIKRMSTIAGSILMTILSFPASSDVHGGLARTNAIDTGTFDMGKVVFLYRSLAYRNAAADILRKARRLPRGAERSAARRYARALRELAANRSLARRARRSRTAGGAAREGRRGALDHDRF